MSMRERDRTFTNRSYVTLSNEMRTLALYAFDKIYECLEICNFGYLHAFLMSVVCKCRPDSFRTRYEKDDMELALDDVRHSLDSRVGRCYKTKTPEPDFYDREYNRAFYAFISECHKQQEDFEQILDFTNEDSKMQSLTEATHAFLQHCSDEVVSSEFDICLGVVVNLADRTALLVNQAANDPNNIAEIRYPSDYNSWMDGKNYWKNCKHITFAQKEEEARQAEERNRKIQEEQEQERIRKSKFVHVKFLILMPIVLAVLYLIGIADLANGYYTFVRIFSLIFLGIFIFEYCLTCDLLEISLLNLPNIAAGAVLILFNPIFPIYMDKDTWIVFDVIAAIVMLAISIFVLWQYSHKPEK